MCTSCQHLIGRHFEGQTIGLNFSPLQVFLLSLSGLCTCQGRHTCWKTKQTTEGLFSSVRSVFSLISMSFRAQFPSLIWRHSVSCHRGWVPSSTELRYGVHGGSGIGSPCALHWSSPEAPCCQRRRRTCNFEGWSYDHALFRMPFWQFGCVCFLFLNFVCPAPASSIFL